MVARTTVAVPEEYSQHLYLPLPLSRPRISLPEPKRTTEWFWYYFMPLYEEGDWPGICHLCEWKQEPLHRFCFEMLQEQVDFQPLMIDVLRGKRKGKYRQIRRLATLQEMFNPGKVVTSLIHGIACERLGAYVSAKEFIKQLDVSNWYKMRASRKDHPFMKEIEWYLSKEATRKRINSMAFRKNG